MFCFVIGFYPFDKPRISKIRCLFSDSAPFTHNDISESQYTYLTTQSLSSQEAKVATKLYHKVIK